MTMTEIAEAPTQTTEATYFHGTFADLQPGDVLVPGEQIGTTVHGVRVGMVFAASTEFDPTGLEWDEDWNTAHNRAAAAYSEAQEWAAHAADLFCEDPRHRYGLGSDWHYDGVIEGMAPGCLKVYEVEPLGPVQQDPSTDPGPSAVMMPSARVIRLVPEAQAPCGEFGPTGC